jgi:hypothetical protein
MTKPIAKAKQTYSIYREAQLIASNCVSLVRATQFIRKDALDERSADRFPVYTIIGTLGLKRSVMYEKGYMRWTGCLMRKEPGAYVCRLQMGLL